MLPGKHQVWRFGPAALSVLLALGSVAGCGRRSLIRLDLLPENAGTARAEAMVTVPTDGVLEINATYSPSPSNLESDDVAATRLQVWAHRADSTSILLQDVEVLPGATVQEAVDLSSLAGETILVAATSRPEGALKWTGMHVVGTKRGWRSSETTTPPAPPKAQEGSPDVLVYLVDALRADALSAYGSPIPTPNFDAVADNGVRFRNAWTTATWTRPASASLLTGLYPTSHTAIDRKSTLPEQIFTLAERFRFLGYRTAAIVSNGNIARHWGFDQGFETYVMAPNAPPVISGVPSFPRADRIVEMARELWQQPRDGRPLFLYVHTVDPHGPYAPPEWLLEQPRPEVDEPNTEKTLVELNTRRRSPSPELLETLRALYLGEVAYADRAFGRLLQALPLNGPGEDGPLVVLTADHGEARMEHGFASHGMSLYEEELEIPLLVRGPGFRGSATVSEPVSLIDVAPTLLVAAGDPAAGLPGVDLASLARGGTIDRSLLAELNFDGRRWSALRRGPMKLLQNLSRGSQFLFDLRQDPGERVDLAESQSDLTSTLLRELQQAQARLVALRPAESSEAVGRPDPAVLENLRALGYLR